MYKSHTISIALASSLSIVLAGCGMTATHDYTVEECAEVMTAYMEMDAIAMLTCRQYLDQVGQEQFNLEVDQLKAAVADGRTMKSDLDAGISQFGSDLGVAP